MTPETKILRRLLERADITGDVEIRGDEVATWPSGVLDALVKQGVVEPFDNATEVVCAGCDERCFVAPQPRSTPGAERPVFLHLCDQRSDIGYVEFSPDDLRRWRLGPAGIARAVATDLNAGPVDDIVHGRLWSLGEARIDGRRRHFLFAWGLAQPDADDVVKAIDKLFVAGSTVLLALSPPASKPTREPGWVMDLGRRLSVLDGRVQMDRDDLAPRVGRAKGAPLIRPFPTPPGTVWENITIRIYEPDHDGLPERAEIVVGRLTDWRTFAEMGMADNRKVPSAPAQAWNHLVLLARSGGELGWGDAAASAQARTLMHSLGVALKEVFGLDDAPFHDYKKKRRWKTRFNLVFVPCGS